MRNLLLALIRFYKRFISPHKGFACAYRVHTGHASCSSLGLRAIRRRGALAGLAILRERTYLCGVVHRRHAAFVRPRIAQRGDCDPGCDANPGCDGPSCDGPGCDLLAGREDCRPFRWFSSCCDNLTCLDCGSCDWPDKRKRRRDREKYVYIPPKVTRPGRD